MAINFPDNPTHGQSATLAGKSFTYDSDVSGWNVSSSAAANSTTVSATAPSNPNSGDNWFDTTDAALNIYYNDGSSAQWVEVGGSSSSLDLSSIALDILPDADSSRSLGSVSKKWKDLYLSGSTIHLGDTQLKGSGGRLTIADSTGTVVNPFNVAPRFSTVPPAKLGLGADDSGRITAVAVDEAGFPITYDWDAYKDSGGSTTIYKDGSLPPQVLSITQPTSGVFRLTCDSEGGGTTPAGEFNFRVKASDGALINTATTSIELAYSLIIQIAARQTRGSSYVEPTSTGVTEFWSTNSAGASNYAYFPEGATASAIGPTAASWPTGKRYIECKWSSTISGSPSFMVGVSQRTTAYSDASSGGYTGANAYYLYTNGNNYGAGLGNNQSSGLSSLVVGDVFQIAYDTDAEKIWFGRNDTWSSNTGDPGAGGAGVSLSYANEGYAFVVASATSSTINYVLTWGGSDYTKPTGFSNF
tara:strand:+ start:134 stop:1549 length:1416 start_codon:yes stop_codon:yes gene_type:complete